MITLYVFPCKKCKLGFCHSKNTEHGYTGICPYEEKEYTPSKEKIKFDYRDWYGKVGIERAREEKKRQLAAQSLYPSWMGISCQWKAPKLSELLDEMGFKRVDETEPQTLKVNINGQDYEHAKGSFTFNSGKRTVYETEWSSGDIKINMFDTGATTTSYNPRFWSPIFMDGI